MIERIRKLLARDNEDGQGLVEYGLILGLIAVVSIASMSATGQGVNGLIQKMATSLTTIT